jgi:tetratricopeptide (TPR) repeat protein
LELLADCYLARFELATVGFSDRADTDRAHETYQRILNTYPTYSNSGWVRYQMGRVFLTEYKSQEAIACFQVALLEPSMVSALTSFCYERLGFIDFYELRQLERALHFLNKAIDTYPVHEDPYWLVQVQTLRSRVLRELKRIDEAVDAARSAVNIAASSESKRGMADALLSVSETLAPLPNRERETIQYLQQFVQISKKPLGIDVTWARPYTPWEMSLHYRLARSAYQAGEYQRALQALDRMIRTAEADDEAIADHRVFALLGNAHYALSHYGEAISAYERALAAAPADAPDLTTIRQYMQFAYGYARRV